MDNNNNNNDNNNSNNNTNDNNDKLVLNNNITALTIIMPNHMHDYIDNFRRNNDKAYPRWQPHINLLFPFVKEEQFPIIAAKLRTAIQDNGFKKFTLHLDTIDHFKQSDCITVHAKPRYDKQIKMLYNLIANTLNITENVKGQDFKAHMTLGQFGKGDVNKVTEIKNNWGSGLCVYVEAIHLIARDISPSSTFKIVDSIMLL